MIKYGWETVQRDVRGRPSMMACGAGRHVTLYLAAPGRSENPRPLAWHMDIELHLDGARLAKRCVLPGTEGLPDWNAMQAKAVQAARDVLHRMYRDLSQILNDFSEGDESNHGT